MMEPDLLSMTMIMLGILIANLLTNKTSSMCLNMISYMVVVSVIMSVMIKLTPIPYIIFLTMVGGLMIIFLYLSATFWTKKETLTLQTKIILPMTMLTPLMPIEVSEVNLLNEINLFSHNLNKMTITLIILLTIMLVFTIEIHTKMNAPFRRKLKIWE